MHLLLEFIERGEHLDQVKKWLDDGKLIGNTKILNTLPSDKLSLDSLSLIIGYADIDRLKSEGTVKYFIDEVVTNDDTKKMCAINCVAYQCVDEYKKEYLFTLIDELDSDQLNLLLTNICRHNKVEMLEYAVNTYHHSIDHGRIFKVACSSNALDVCEHLIDRHRFSVSRRVFESIKLRDS